MKPFESLKAVWKQPVGTVVLTQKPVRGPWGGSNQFVKQMQELLLKRGYDVRFDLARKPDVLVIVDPRKSLNKQLGLDEVREFKERHPDVAVLHRINECDLRKSTDFMDDLLEQVNEYADHTVFISEWLRQYHTERWFDSDKPHSVIYNGADPSMFYPARVKREISSARQSLRIVTHHWAPAYSKGYDVYERLDRMIAEGELEGVTLRIIGRWPPEIRWRTAEVFGPLHGHELAERLRECDAYINASRWEPCGMSQVEGIQCGLPLIYHRDGGGIVDVGLKCGVQFTNDLGGAIQTMRENYDTYRTKALGLDLGGDRMCMEFARLIRVLCFGGVESSRELALHESTV